MSGFIPKRVLNARIGTTIEKNQTPMEAGLAPRIGKSGASIRLYYQRVDECFCPPPCEPITIVKRIVWYPYNNALDSQGNFIVITKTFFGIQEYQYANHPFDVVGWDGYYFPWIFSIHDFEPLVGSIHRPPPVHQTFQAPGFVLCSFVPRLFDFHPDAIPAPYPHSNLDSDEIIYYSRGDFMSRQGITQESITLHPMGLPHGPQPGKYHSSVGKEKTEELAVMIDTFKPLNVTQAAREIDDKDYPFSWLD